ncbi:Tol-Pal system beta propeller repeat protein TolB [Paracoccus sp. 1_MG-2023]|uniref:Tol-Pal system beta propeller repeat protein TolB n=1 Tax=Paracoccus sp. 1_MG-2023 TaxID=3062651 RepID=UPI001C092869|nr:MULTISPECIES: Tol-Pal system beta propeller repeat protein TolB [unclassified Paracoccus (in: a-proteobacteria)]MBU2957525.1 Tol-Pal system protein TolB [Paracoccus sp. C2R09]MDO6669815.1 Tol-Pal system beta propeller repeat protein TolB [Paracoccus sp. 1_MG-2023]
MFRPLILASTFLTAGLAATVLPVMPAHAQDEPLRIEITDGVIEPMSIAIPAFHGDEEVAAKVRQVVADDLTGTGLFSEIPAEAQVARPGSFAEPVSYEDWRAVDAQALVTAEVRQMGENISVRFRLFDVISGQPQGDGMQFDARAADWRRAAHKIADQVYARLTGERPYFDSRIAFVQETGPKSARIKRIGVMDYDGKNTLWMTNGASLVLAPKFSPDGTKILYTSYDSGFPQIRLLDVATVTSRALTQDAQAMSFSPSFGPKGQSIVYSREQGGNTDIWLMAPNTGAGRPLTDAPSIETSPSFSPDGQRIVFESDRSGSPQLYIMGVDGGEPVRISFGDGRYGSPVWSPKGDMIAFTKQVGDRFHIGIMRTDGSGEKMLTESFLDEGPTWAPNGRVVMFTRVTPGGNGQPRLHSVDITGRNMRPMNLDFAASDPSWGPLMQ